MATTTDIPLPKHKREVIERAVIRFAGDSGDGMQVTGSQFTNTVALYGNDIATFRTSLPRFARLRARYRRQRLPVAFFVERNLYAGDAVDVLIVMNPAALKMNIADLKANKI